MSGLDIWVYLAQVAPVVVVMAIAIVALWFQNKELIGDIKESDLNNLETLQNLSKAIEKLDENGNRNVEDLKRHVTERVEIIADRLK